MLFSAKGLTQVRGINLSHEAWLFNGKNSMAAYVIQLPIATTLGFRKRPWNPKIDGYSSSYSMTLYRKLDMYGNIPKQLYEFKRHAASVQVKPRSVQRVPSAVTNLWLSLTKNHIITFFMHANHNLYHSPMVELANETYMRPDLRVELHDILSWRRHCGINPTCRIKSL